MTLAAAATGAPKRYFRHCAAICTAQINGQCLHPSGFKPGLVKAGNCFYIPPRLGGGRFTQHYRAFISYSHADKAWGEWLHRWLETYRVPKKIIGRETAFGPIPARLHPIFRDRDELSAATDLSVEINAALEASMFLVVLCSPAAAASHWVNEEIKAFKRMHGENRVRAIIVDGAPFSGDPATECFPEALRFRCDPSGAITDARAEPIAADIRPEGDGKKYAISKLVAGLTGASLDDLVQREQQRRNARMRVVAAALGVLVLVLSGLTFDALRQRNVARLAQADAEFQRDEAQDLVEYMLTDLRDKLNAVGRLDVLESVGERLSESYAKQDIAKLDADALGRRARVQLLLGEVDNTRGDLDAALTRYRQAAETTKEQLRRDPDNAQRIFDHSQSVFWVGYIAWQRGDVDTARGFFTQYHDQATRLVEIEPDNDDYQAELEYSYSNLGTLEMDEGNAAAAEDYFRKSLAVSSLLAAKYPDDIDRLIAQGQSYAWLADALHRQTKLGEARNTREREIEFYQNAFSVIPANTVVQQSLSVGRYRLAQIEIAAGRLDSAILHAKEAAKLADELLALEPESTQQAERTSLAHVVLAEVYYHKGRLNDARDAIQRSMAIAEPLVSRRAGVAVWKNQNITQPKLILAQVEAASGNANAASALFEEIVADLGVISAGGDAEPQAIRIYCAATAGIARLSTDGAEEWGNIVRVLSDDQAKHGPESLILLLEAHQRIDNSNGAIGIAAELYAKEYRHPDFMKLLKADPALLAAARSAAVTP